MTWLVFKFQLGGGFLKCLFRRHLRGKSGTTGKAAIVWLSSGPTPHLGQVGGARATRRAMWL